MSSYIPENLLSRACRDDTINESPDVVRINIEKSMKDICDIYSSGGHKQIWASIDRYAFHALVTSYTLSKRDEDHAFKDIVKFEKYSRDFDEVSLTIIGVLEKHLLNALTCHKRAEFSYHCDAIKDNLPATQQTQLICTDIIDRFRKVSHTENPSSGRNTHDDLLDDFVECLYVRLKNMYDENEIKLFMKRIPKIESSIID